MTNEVQAASLRLTMQGVWAKNYRDGPLWTPETVVDRPGPLSYLIRLPNGDLWHRHVDQLREGSPVEIETPEEDDFSPSTPPGEQSMPDLDGPGARSPVLEGTQPSEVTS